MSQEFQTIDLTIEGSDDEDDDVPICLSSSNSTPCPSSSPEPDEIQVIETPGRQGISKDTRRRARRRVVHSPEGDAVSTTLPDLFDGRTGPDTPNAEASGTPTAPNASTPRSTRPKPKRRVHVEDEDIPASVVPAPEPALPEAWFGFDSSTPRENSQTSPAKRIWKKKSRALEWKTTEELLNSVSSTSKSRRPDTANFTPVSERTSRAEKSSTGVRPGLQEQNWRSEDGEGPLESIKDNIASSASRQALLQHAESGDARISSPGGKDASLAKFALTRLILDVEPTIQTPSPTNAFTGSTSSSSGLMEVDVVDDEMAIPTPGPSRTSTRTKKKSQRAVESEATAHLLGINVRASLSASTSSSMARPRASSTFSTASRSSIHNKSLRSGTRCGAHNDEKQIQNEDEEESDHVHEPNQMDGIEESIPEPKTASSEGFYILPAPPALETPDTARRNRKRSSPPPEIPMSSTQTPRKAASNVGSEAPSTISPIRRGSRDRKASEAMKVYVAQSGGPRFSKRLSQKSLPASVAPRLPTPPPLDSSRDATPSLPESSRFSKRLSETYLPTSLSLRLPTPPPMDAANDAIPTIQSSSASSLRIESPTFSARTGFSLPTVPWQSPLPERPPVEATPTATTNVNTARTIRTRRSNDDSKAPETPTPVAPASSAQASRAPKPAINEEKKMEDIPFPPCDEGDNEYLITSDFEDAKLMAAFAALDTSGNKAMSADEIAEVCVQRGWLPKR